MPTYEYQCTDCRREFEVRQRISEAPLTRCETCGGTLKRLLSAAPFILKGEGWYVTDYPSESRKKAMASEKGSGTAGDKSGDTAAKGDTAGKKGDTAGKKEAATSETSSPSTGTSTTPTSGSAATPSKTSSSD